MTFTQRRDSEEDADEVRRADQPRTLQENQALVRSARCVFVCLLHLFVFTFFVFVAFICEELSKRIRLWFVLPGVSLFVCLFLCICLFDPILSYPSPRAKIRDSFCMEPTRRRSRLRRPLSFLQRCTSRFKYKSLCSIGQDPS